MTRNGRFISLIVFCTFFFIQRVIAQNEQYKFRHLDINSGLSHHEISTIFKDSRGFIWIGTIFGLNRFDGYTVKSFLNDPRDTTSLVNNAISQIFETPDRQLGVLTFSGLTLYNPENETFERNLDRFYSKYGTSGRLNNIVRDKDGSFWFVEPYRLIKYLPADRRSIVFQHIDGDSTSIVNDSISDFSIDRNGNHWIVHAKGIAEKVDDVNNQGQVVQRVSALYDFNNHRETSYKILSDTDGDLWFYVSNFNQGVFYYNASDKTIQHLTATEGQPRLNNNIVSAFVEGNDGTIWIGTDHGGINLIDKKRLAVRYIYHQDEDIRSLSENSVKYFYKDDQGIIWVGTYKRGVSYYHESIYRFDLYKHYSLDPTSLPFEDINRFAEDEKGNLWIGTNGGGLLYFDRRSGKFKQYQNEPGNENSLSGNVIVSLCRDAENNLWIGTYNEGLTKFDGKKFVRYRHTVGDTSSLPSRNIWEIFEDSKKRLWIGTLNEGVALLDKKTGRFQRLKVGGTNALHSRTIDTIIEDRQGNIWFGTISGIDVLSPDGKTFTHYEASSNPNSLSNNTILDIKEDSKGRIWIGTMDGLNLFDQTINGFRVYKENLPHNAVLTIQEDSLGNVWLATLNGLCEMTLVDNDSKNVAFKYYTESDGLQGLQFNLNASFKTRRGELVFGGPTGFNIFKAERNVEDRSSAKIVFLDLELYEKQVNIGEKIDGVVVLNKSISEATEIVLPPNKNFFSVKFSALNYFNPEKTQYLYQLEDLNSGWLPVNIKTHEIVFNGLSPGHYKLRVKAANSDGEQNTEGVLSITIFPPFWKTNTAFALYALLLIIILFVGRKVIQHREKLKFALEQERREIQRVHELDMMKVKFFTNVSHEFRTPLTLILTPIERLIKRTVDQDLVAQFQLIQRNGKRLMNLVNQLLDFKKLEVQEIRLNPSRGDIIGFVKDTVLSFSDLSEDKNIKLEFHSSREHFETLFDHDKLEKILFNLVSNAFKFTLENGVVSINLTLLERDGEAFLQMEIKDTGIGIPEDKLDKIFEPFFQNELPKTMNNQGSGIGLAITKEFVRIHGGQIKLTSEVGKGSCFTLLLPVKETSMPIVAGEIETNIRNPGETNSARVEQTNSMEEPIGKQSKEIKQKSLLLVEDNDDFRFYLKDNLKFLYTIYEARNGAEGWKQILAFEPDLIVSDIMMPEINGVDLCMKIKGDERFSHIPIILLTARSTEEQRLEGLESGADDYITKPFNFEILESRIRYLLEQREKSQKTFRKTLDIKSSELQITPLDVKFIENAIKCVEKNVSSADFSVEDLGVELGISRAYLYKKILALTGKSPLEFIRTIRLQHAAQLLAKSQLTVSEVAYKVGFNNPKYFTKYFKEQFNILPSNYAASLKKNE